MDSDVFSWNYVIIRPDADVSDSEIGDSDEEVILESSIVVEAMNQRIFLRFIIIQLRHHLLLKWKGEDNLLLKQKAQELILNT